MKDLGTCREVCQFLPVAFQFAVRRALLEVYHNPFLVLSHEAVFLLTV